MEIAGIIITLTHCVPHPVLHFCGIVLRISKFKETVRMSSFHFYYYLFVYELYRGSPNSRSKQPQTLGKLSSKPESELYSKGSSSEL